MYEDDSEDEWAPVPLPVVGVDETYDGPMGNYSPPRRSSPDPEAGYGSRFFLSLPPGRQRRQAAASSSAAGPANTLDANAPTDRVDVPTRTDQ